MNSPNTDRVVQFVVNTRSEEVPRKAISVAREAILDCIGVGLAGARQAVGEITCKWAQSASGSSQASAWGMGFKTSAHDAALVNGTSAHALDFDDVTWGLIGHPSASLVPAILALGEYVHASGKEILLAYSVGFEVMAKIGRTTQPKHSLEAGWHATSSIGSFGTAAACCKLLKLDAPQVERALGIVYSMTSGNVSNFGTMTKPLHAGLAARNGVQAAQFSELGFTASPHPLDGPRGFYEVYSRGLPRDLTPLEELGADYELITRGIVIKPYPCGVATHPGIDAALELRNKYSLAPGDIDRIEVGETKYTYDKLSYHVPGTGLEGKFSMEYAVARALLDNRVTAEAFTDKAVQDPEVQNLLRRIKTFVDEDIERVWKIGSRPVHMRIWLKDGREIEKKVDISRGNPEFPLSGEQLRTKFTNCAKLSLDQKAIQSALKIFEDLEELADISELSNLLIGTASTVTAVS